MRFGLEKENRKTRLLLVLARTLAGDPHHDVFPSSARDLRVPNLMPVDLAADAGAARTQPPQDLRRPSTDAIRWL